MTTSGEARPRFDDPVRFHLGAVLLVLGWLIFLTGWMPGHLFSATRFILYDQGSYLYAVGRWQAGESLYRDFAWQYGPLALGWYRGFAAIGGNTPFTLVLAGSAAFAVAWVLVARLVWRVAGWAWGAGLAVAGLLPVMAQSGPFAFNGPHGAVEMLLLAVSARVVAAEAAPWRPWVLGGLAGLLQWVRFGPHAMLVAAVLLIAAWQLRSGAPDWRTWTRGVAGFAGRLLAAYAITVLPLAGWFLAALPAVGAWEQLWPSHMTAVYAATYAHRWPQIGSWQAFGLTWLPVFIGVGAALAVFLAGLVRGARGKGAGRPGAAAGIALFPLYYLIACPVLFRNDYTVSGHVWLAWPGLALLAWNTSGWKRAGLILAVLPALLVAPVGVWSQVKAEQARQAGPLGLPNGQQLWFGPAEAARFARLQSALAAGPGPRRLAVFLGGGGIHHFFGTQRVGRHWWFLPGFVRPWEEETTWRAVLRHDLILVAEMGQDTEAPPAPGVIRLWVPFTGARGERLLPHLQEPRSLEGVGVLVRVQP